MAISGKQTFQEGTDPTTPATGYATIFVRSSDSRLYLKDDTGTVVALSSPSTTDNLTEGVTNLYFTDERAQDAVGNTLVDSSKIDFTYNDIANTITATIVAGSLVNADISASAAITYSKLSLTNSIVNADISSSAAIALTKLAALSINRVLISDASGVITTSSATNLEASFLSGVTSSIQTQIDNKQASDSDLTALAGLSSTGLIVRTGTGTATVRTIQSGTGMSVANGNGVSADPSIAISNTTVTAGTYGSSTTVPSFTVNAQGQLTAASALAFTSAAISDFTTAARTAVVDDSITNGVTTKAPSQNAVYDALYEAPDMVAAQIFQVSTASHTITSTEFFILVSNATATSITLPDPTIRRTIYIKDTSGVRGANPITFIRFGSETIEGLAASRQWHTNYGMITLKSDGSNWWIL